MSPITLNIANFGLVKKNLTSKRLAENLGRKEAIVSWRLINDIQFTLNTMASIAELFNIQITDLINNKQK